jgi:hypothetical protein
VEASRHEDLVSDGGVSPPVCNPLIVPERGVVLARCHPPGSAVDAELDAAAWARRAERTAEGDVVDVPHARSVSPWAPPMPAQHGARCDPSRTRTCCPPQTFHRDIQEVESVVGGDDRTSLDLAVVQELVGFAGALQRKVLDQHPDLSRLGQTDDLHELGDRAPVG